MTALGAAWDEHGVDFAVFSTAEAVELCLLDDAGREQARIAMSGDQDVWSVRVPSLDPGQHYAYRAHGVFDPARGLRFDPERLLADPYARAFDPVDLEGMASCIVDRSFDWTGDPALDIPWSETVLYETHVQGLSQLHPAVAPELRGTYAGLASEPILEHLKNLGITAVELLPVHQFVTEVQLRGLGLENYWGYMTLGFFAPHARYRAGAGPGCQVNEFKSMVRSLHQAGLEVILDVVFNHTCEGGSGGPTLAFRGLANEVYYRIDPHDPLSYVDTTGTGNTLNVDRPEVLRLIMDSLRYWVTEMHVDGFRFDLAATLARDSGSFDRLAAFFDLVYQDPIVRDVKLIAEPWDIGDYQVGRFPRGWAEWNDRYRDDVRNFWRQSGGVSGIGYRLSGSSDLYGADRRGPDTSVNFVTAHDGKTLHDLVTYERKHNEANGEQNRDGAPDDRAQNFGVEGETNDPAIVAARARQRRNFIATLMVSLGVPMLLGGDERARTQRGNNNAYCQGNEISWYDWAANTAAEELTAFTRNAIAVQRMHATLRRRSFLHGDGDVRWLDSEGSPMTTATWNDPNNHFIALLLAGDRAEEPDDDVLLVLNAEDAEQLFVIPTSGRRFELLLDTGVPDGLPPAGSGLDAGATLTVARRTMLIAAAPR
jgi:isoamylase